MLKTPCATAGLIFWLVDSN